MTERPNFEPILELLIDKAEEKRYNVIEILSGENNGQLQIKTNPEFINIVKQFALEVIVRETTKMLEELNYTWENKDDSILKIILEKEEGEYKAFVEANDIFENQMEFFKIIQNSIKEMLLLLEEKISDYEKSKEEKNETEVVKMIFDKEYNILNTSEVKEEFERVKEKYSFIKSMSILENVFEKDQCDYVEFVYKTDRNIEWDEIFYTYKKEA